jgi:hypothetical protein
MTPIKFTVKNGVTHFHYKTSELIDFVRRGKKDGNVGVILTKREGNILTYRGFGTIENPFTHIVSISLNHFPPFDGEMLTDEQRLIPPKPFFTSESTRFVIIDM